MKDWDQHYRNAPLATPTPSPLLQDYSYLLPRQGRALDLACGRGGNALLLAGCGLDTHAWDSSAVAIAQLGSLAAQQGLLVHGVCRDLIQHPPEPNSFDVIVVSRFLHRPLCPALSAALRPGGLLFYQSFLRLRRDTQQGPTRGEFLLEEGELLTLFTPLQLRLYREEGLSGDLSQGERNEAWLIAQRPYQ
ncbi:MAG: class I SAM-dependent methyltransferase [Gammaproteobacteria bacterium]|nr:class I SAM-dependent methyltransferase [Gammaproteobacteria bacterium]